MKPAVRTNIDGHTDLAARYSQVCSAIGAAGKRFSRPEGSVTLVAVSKTRSADQVRAVANLGQRDFGENQVQEAVDKIHLLADMALSWHFIGAIQSNKCRDIAANFDWVHSIDRFKIARRLSQMRPQSRGRIDDRISIRRTADAGHTGRHCRTQFTAHSRLVLLTRFAQSDL